MFGLLWRAMIACYKRLNYFGVVLREGFWFIKKQYLKIFFYSYLKNISNDMSVHD